MNKIVKYLDNKWLQDLKKSSALKYSICLTYASVTGLLQLEIIFNS